GLGRSGFVRGRSLRALLLDVAGLDDAGLGFRWRFTRGDRVRAAELMDERIFGWSFRGRGRLPGLRGVTAPEGILARAICRDSGHWGGALPSDASLRIHLSCSWGAALFSAFGCAEGMEAARESCRHSVRRCAAGDWLDAARKPAGHGKLDHYTNRAERISIWRSSSAHVSTGRCSAPATDSTTTARLQNPVRGGRRLLRAFGI